MRPVVQKDSFGCGVACVASIFCINYQDSLELFISGKKKAGTIGFSCKEILEALENGGLKYKYRYVNRNVRNKVHQHGAIVFLRRSDKYPAGHYLCRINSKWMDPWINFPVKKRKAGVRKRLPEKPIYVIYPV